MPTLTIFTPTYNRAQTLSRTYQSLCRQTCRDFCWLVIDDGSTDGTRDLVERWIAEELIPIRYHYQENQGMHGAHNAAYRLIETELNTCIDSDDYMPDDAVEKIVGFWKEKGSDAFAGLVGLDCMEDGRIIGGTFPEGLSETTLSGYYCKGGKGDKKLVYRTDIVRQYPEYPRFEGERYFSLGYKYLLIDQDYHLLTLNKPLVIVNYQPDGSSFGMWSQYWNNPNGFRYLRKEHMKYNNSWKSRVRSSIHYVAHTIRAGKYRELCCTPCPVLTFFCIPEGFLLYRITKYHVRHNKQMKF